MSKNGSKLDSILQHDKQMQGSGNTSLSFKSVSRKELKKKQQEAQDKQPQAGPQQQSATQQQSQSATGGGIKFATPVNAVKYNADNVPETLGFLGLALIQNPQKITSIMCYDTTTQQQFIVIPITDVFSYVLQPNNYISFWDLNGQQYACQTQSEESLQALVLHIEINKYTFHSIKINADPTIGQPKLFTTNLSPTDQSQRVIKSGDMVRIKYTCHLLSGTQQCEVTNNSLQSILGPIVLDSSSSSSKDGSDNGKSLVIGQIGKDLEALHHGLDGAVKNIQRVIIAPASMCYGAKETTKIPPNSDLIFLCTIDKVRQAKEQQPEQSPPQQQQQSQSLNESNSTPTLTQQQSEDQRPTSSTTEVEDDDSARKQRLKQRMARVSALGGGQVSILPTTTTPSTNHNTTAVEIESTTTNHTEAPPVQVLPLQQQQQPQTIQHPQHHIEQQHQQPQQQQQQPQQHIQPTPLLSSQQSYNMLPQVDQQQQQQPVLQYAPSHMHLPQSQLHQQQQQQQQQQQFFSPSLHNHQQQQSLYTPQQQQFIPQTPVYQPNNPQFFSPSNRSGSYNQNPSTATSPQQYNLMNQNNNSQQLLEHTSNRVEHLYVMLSTPIVAPTANGTPAEDVKPEQIAPLSATHIIATFQHLINQVNAQNDLIEQLKLKARQSSFTSAATSIEDPEQIEQLQQQIITLQKAQRVKNKEYNELVIKLNDLEMQLESKPVEKGHQVAQVPNVEESPVYIQLLNQFTTLKSTHQSLESQFQQLQSQQQQQQQQQQADDKPKEEEKVIDTTQFDTQIAQLQDELNQSKLHSESLQNKNDELLQQIGQLESNIQEQKDSSHVQIQQLQTQIQQLQDELTTIKSESNNNVQPQELPTVNIEEEPKFIQLATELRDITSQHQTQLELVQELKATNELLVGTQTSLQTKCNELESQYQEKDVQYNQVQSQVEQLQIEFTEYKTKYVFTEEDVDAVRTQVQEETILQAKARQEKIITQAKQRVEDLNAQIEELQQQVADQEQQINDITEQAKQRIDKVKAAAMSLKTQNEELLEQHSQCISNDDLQALKDEIETLRLQIETQRNQYEEQITSLQNDSSEQQLLQGQINTLTESHNAQVEKYQQEITILEDKLVQINNTNVALEEKLAQLASNDTTTTTTTTTDEQLLQSKNEELANKDEELASIVAENRDLQTTIDAKNICIDELTKQLEQIQVDYQEQQTKIEQLSQHNSSHNDDDEQTIAQQQITIQQLQSSLTAKEEQIIQLQSQLTTLQTTTTPHTAEEIDSNNVSNTESDFVVLDSVGDEEPVHTNSIDEPTKEQEDTDETDVVNGHNEDDDNGDDNNGQSDEPQQDEEPQQEEPQQEEPQDEQEPQQDEEQEPQQQEEEEQQQEEEPQQQEEEPQQQEKEEPQQPVEDQHNQDENPFDTTPSNQNKPLLVAPTASGEPPKLPQSSIDSLFGADDDDNDDSLLAGSTQQQTTPSTPSVSNNLPPKTTVPSFLQSGGLFGDDDDDEVFGTTSPTLKLSTTSGNSLFDDDLF